MKIAYLDSSVVVRYYLVNDPHHAEAVALIDDTDGAVVTGTWTVTAQNRQSRVRLALYDPTHFVNADCGE